MSNPESQPGEATEKIAKLLRQELYHTPGGLVTGKWGKVRGYWIEKTEKIIAEILRLQSSQAYAPAIPQERKPREWNVYFYHPLVGSVPDIAPTVTDPFTLCIAGRDYRTEAIRVREVLPEPPAAKARTLESSKKSEPNLRVCICNRRDIPGLYPNCPTHGNEVASPASDAQPEKDGV